jgi:hypothetical protein
MVEEFLTEGRVKVLRRLLVVILALGGLVVLLSIPPLAGGNTRVGVVLLGVGAVLAVSSWLARAAVLEGAPNARRLSILTGVLTLVFSVPLMPLGLLTVVAGLGLLVVVFAPEREPR